MPRILKTPVLVTVLALSLGCTKKKPEVEGYRVANYDTSTGQWTIIRNGRFDGRYVVKRITAVCDYIKRGNGERVAGPNACDLRVGRVMVPNTLPGEGKKEDFLDILEIGPDTLFITEGDGPDRVDQGFTILKQEVLPSGNGH
jgi:hypothetical protein